jgi:predicted Zn-dependent protease
MGGCSPNNLNYDSIVQGATKGFKAATLDERQEVALGQSVSLAVTNQYGVASNEQLQHYVILVGRTVASRTPMKNYPWVFGVLDTDQVNAFSGPGGYVWVTRGAIQQMQDESELAGVLGHEIGHVNRHHGLNLVKQAGALDALATGANANNDVAQVNAQLGNVSDKLVDVIVKRGFSAPQEFEADAESVKYVAAAGYDPSGFLHFLQRIRQQQKSGANLFSTHPDMDDRIKRVGDAISSAGTGGRGATNRDRFNQMAGKQGVARADGLMDF